MYTQVAKIVYLQKPQEGLGGKVKIFRENWEDHIDLKYSPEKGSYETCVPNPSAPSR